MTDMLDRLQSALADRYTIERELGRGGMAIVYLAEDLKHERKVALKVLRPELAASLGAERFLREIRTAAQLTHPNILPLHDSGEADGTLYYTMPYLDGESLRDRLNREKQLPIEEALQITREVADALGYAHEQGIIHRDIKPENILFQRGHALVADFGIARAVSAAGAETLTETGLAVGTPAYMSPEQGVGSGALDGRSDLYSLGCVLYEMLTGETPYLGNTPQAIIAKKLSEPTPRVSVVRDKVPTAVEAVLDRALSRTPADRFATAEQFVEALSREAVQPETAKPRRRFGRVAAIIGVLAIAFMALGAYGAWWFFATGRPGTVFASGVVDPGDRVLLADFVNRTNDSTLVYAVEEAIRADLSDPRLIRLVDRAEVRQALERMERPPDTRLDDEEVAREVAERENAKAFIAGEVSRIGSSYQITARVLSSADGAELRSEWVTARDEDAIIDAVGRLGKMLRRGIGESVRSAASHPELERVSTAWLPALRKYSEARHIVDTYRGSRELAIELFEQAIQEDSAFAMAYASLSTVLINADRIAAGRRAAAMAYRYRDRLSEVERLRVHVIYERRVALDPVAAEVAQRQLISLMPDDPGPLINLSDLLLSQRRWSEAESVAVRALDMGERGLAVYYNAVEALQAQRRFAAADSMLERLAREGRGFDWVNTKLEVLFGRRQYDAALAFHDSVVRAEGRNAPPWGFPYLPWRIAGIQGRLKAAEAGFSSNPFRLAESRVFRALRLHGDTAEASRLLDVYLRSSDWNAISAERRPYAFVTASLAESGRVDEAKQLYAEWEAVGDVHPDFRSSRYQSIGAIAMAEGLYDSAATAFLRWHAAPLVGIRYTWNRGLVEAAAALDQLGNPDSAIVLYERALALPSLWARNYEDYWYPLVLRRLGELHESLGHREQAMDYYVQFIDLWQDADPELQPQVDEARTALARLTAEPSR